MKAGQIGRSLPRKEGRDKVTGRAEYIHNLCLPGMLHAKIFRSAIAHGRIKSIDTAAAKALPGVFGIFTADDIRTVIPNPYYGPAFHDQPILAIDKVRHIGEPVAVALAEDPHVVEEAARLITAEYDALPVIEDEIEAMTSTTLVHDVLKPAGTFPDLKHLDGRSGTNIALDFHLRRGDTEKAFAEADFVFEHRFRTQQVMHTPLEPMISVAEAGDGTLTIHTASQSPSFVRIEMARLLGWKENQVRVKTAFLGGGFGAKLYIKLEALAAALALLARRPVRVALTMEEQFFTITKHPTTFDIKSGVTKDGRITARQCEVWWNGGAYADIGPRVTQKSGFTAAGPYDIENVRIDSYALYTNRPPAGALRGFGIPQLVWAYESHTDLITRAMKLDPLEFRLKNICLLYTSLHDRSGASADRGLPADRRDLCADRAALRRLHRRDVSDRGAAARQRHLQHVRSRRHHLHPFYRRQPVQGLWRRRGAVADGGLAGASDHRRRRMGHRARQSPAGGVGKRQRRRRLA